MLSHGNIWIDLGLEGACKGGHRDLVDLMISKGANDWGFALQAACEGGHRDLVDLIIEKGKEGTWWKGGLVWARKGGHGGLVHHLIRQMLVRGVEIPKHYAEDKQRVIDEIEQDRYSAELIRSLVIKLPIEWDNLRKYIL